ncbi:MAG: threonine--tRNA ligase [Patescibacteria group bacterium]|jgi:threonyl-tRNA synthetase
MAKDLETIRHSASHVLAQAVLEFFPDAKLGIGPAIDQGFYYDFDFDQKTLSPEDLPKIEAKMREIIKQNQAFEHYEVEAEEAIEYIKTKKQPYKLELAEELKKTGEKKLSFYRMIDAGGEHKFTDLCAGPHVKSAKEIGAVKLLKIAGAYWRGDEKNKMLQRIYGTAFNSEKELDEYLKNLKLAEERDHRKLGKELGLFVFSDLVGPGLPLYTNKGAIIRREIINYSNELQKGIGYQEVHTPNINKAELFKVSGHYEKYKDSMFKVTSNYTDEEYFLKPMNCPHHTQIYASQQRSYKDLPIRIADFANLYRDEKPGELSGLTRLRAFCQDDGHCFCREDQIKEEFLNVLGIIKTALTTYQMDYAIRLSLWDPKHPENYLGEAKVWEKSQQLLEEILVENKINYVKAIGEAAIYGPKMDLISKDSLGREWQISTIQLDFIMPKRFGLTYIDTDGKEKTPVMIHRAIVGSPERFLAILIEHYAAVFPVWLAPVQVQIITVTTNFTEAAKKLAASLEKSGIRTEVDDLNETVGYKIRKSEKAKVPYTLVIGEKEANSPDLSIRVRGQKEMLVLSREKFIEKVVGEIKDRR